MSNLGDQFGIYRENGEHNAFATFDELSDVETDWFPSTYFAVTVVTIVNNTTDLSANLTEGNGAACPITKDQQSANRLEKFR